MTADEESFSLQPSFLQGSAGRLFTGYFKPAQRPKAAVLCVAPFGEEMNRTRSLVAAQARAFAQLGYACLVLDLFGTGDSEGDLPEVTWETWCSDVATATQWLEETAGCPVILWGIRFGSLLAAEVADRHPERFQRLLFWQPVSNGKTYLTQMLRLRVGALVDRKEPPETTTEMRAKLDAGGCVEVSGYILPGQLTKELDNRRLTDCEHWADKSVDWLECIADASKSLPKGSQNTIDKLQAQGARVNTRCVVAPQVWSLHKQADASALVSATTALFNE